ncbi:hypothetical protein BDR06DRAFT_959307 [Suillus hirtellus]|nr:hypothetical protein BDR06DRAFT_959307 [Suillus hirtellus]
MHMRDPHCHSSRQSRDPHRSRNPRTLPKQLLSAGSFDRFGAAVARAGDIEEDRIRRISCIILTSPILSSYMVLLHSIINIVLIYVAPITKCDCHMYLAIR